MTRTAEQYRDQLHRLEPPGKLWPWFDPATLLRARLAHGAGDELSRTEESGEDVLKEAFVDSIDQLLEDWERVLGLPDSCVGVAATTELRRNAVVTKFTQRSTHAPADLVAASAALGFFVFAIEEYQAMRAAPEDATAQDLGSLAGDALTQGPAGWPDSFTVHAPLATITEFRASQSRCTDPLREFGNDPLECVIERIKPAHSEVLFNYAGTTMLPADEWGVFQAAAPFAVVGEPLPPRSDADAVYELNNLPGLQGFAGDREGDFPDEDLVVWGQVLVKLPTNSAQPVGADFTVELLRGFPATPISATAEFTWQADGSLLRTGGTLAGATATDLGGGWWRCTLPWLVKAADVGEDRWIQIGPFPKTAPGGGEIYSIWVGHAGYSHVPPQ